MIENLERLVSSVPSDLAGTRDPVEAHAAYANEEVLLLVEGHAERVAADMGKMFGLVVMRREEADDVALPVAAIQIVILSNITSSGPSTWPRPMISTSSQLVVQRVGRAGVPVGRRTRQISTSAATCRPWSRACRDSSPISRRRTTAKISISPSTIDPAPHRGRAGRRCWSASDDDRADQDLGDGAAAAAEADAAEHDRGQDRNLETDPVSVPAPPSREA